MKNAIVFSTLYLPDGIQMPKDYLTVAGLKEGLVHAEVRYEPAEILLFPGQLPFGEKEVWIKNGKLFLSEAIASKIGLPAYDFVDIVIEIESFSVQHVSIRKRGRKNG